MVIAAQCMFVSGAKQKYVKSANKAVVLLLSLSLALAKEAEVPSPKEKGGRVVLLLVVNQDKFPLLWIHMLCTSPSCHSFVVRPINTSQQYTQQNKNINQTKEN